MITVKINYSYVLGKKRVKKSILSQFQSLIIAEAHLQLSNFYNTPHV